MKLRFAHNQYLMSKRISRYSKLGKIVNRILGSTNIGQYARANIFKKLIRSLPHQSFNNILDLGCGQGEYAFMMAGALEKANITALDVEPDRLKSINEVIDNHRINNMTTHLGPCDSLPENKNFDFIYSVDVFEHIKENEMPFKEAYNRLVQGGRLLVKMPSKIQKTVLPERWFSDHHQWLDDEHIGQVYMLEDLKDRMNKEGFEIEQAYYTDGRISRFSWELGYLSRKAGVISQVLMLPFLKGLVLIDRLVFNNQTGNSIQIIGKKI